MSEEPELAEAPKAPEAPKPKPVRIFYPPLFAIFPVLSVFSANLSLVPYNMMLRPIAIAALAALGLWLMFGLLLRNIGRGAVAASTLVVMGFAYSRIYKLLEGMYIAPSYRMWCWAGFTLVLVVLAAFKFRSHKVLNILSVSMVLAAFAQIVVGEFKSASLMSQKRVTQTSATVAGKNQPDIIYIILDGYGRSDGLKRALGYDNSWFIKGLEERGFYVAKDAHANYCQTELSLASSLNMDLIPVVLPNMTSQMVDRKPLEAVTDGNGVAEYLRKRGYVFAAITSRFPPIQFDSADVNMRTMSGMTLIETALVQMTPFVADETTVISMFQERRQTMMNEFDSLSSLTVKNSRPRFVVAHILAPHPPFVFGPDGEPRQKGLYGYWDGSDYMEHVGSAKDYRDGYVGQAEYVGKQVLKTLDVLLAGSGSKPVILLQGDHGSKLRLDQGMLERTDVNECFPNLSAYYVPDSVRKNLYPGITPVNSFRVLFNGMFGETMKLRPDKSWYSTFPYPYDFIEVTPRLADHTDMASVPVPEFGPKPQAN